MLFDVFTKTAGLTAQHGNCGTEFDATWKFGRGGEGFETIDEAFDGGPVNMPPGTVAHASCMPCDRSYVYTGSGGFCLVFL